MATFMSTLTTTKGTAKDDPASQELVVVAGTLTRLRIYVPPGPRGELYLRLKHRGVQILPARADTWWRPDDAVMDYPVNYPVAEGDLDFYLEGASPDANFDHYVDFELTVEPSKQSETAQPPGLLSKLLKGVGG